MIQGEGVEGDERQERWMEHIDAGPSYPTNGEGKRLDMMIG